MTNSLQWVSGEVQENPESKVNNLEVLIQGFLITLIHETEKSLGTYSRTNQEKHPPLEAL